MEIIDLRVGNKIKLDDQEIIIDDHYLKLIEEQTYFSIEPIKIDSEYIMANGFINTNQKLIYNFSESKNVVLTFYNNVVILIEFNIDDTYSYFNENVEDLHILQNLFFYRFEEELSLK
jgi:hypothetical protein